VGGHPWKEIYMPSRTCHVKFFVGIPAAAILFLTAYYPAEARTEQSGGTARNGERQAGDVRTHSDQQYSRDGRRSNHHGEQWKHISGTIKRSKQVELRGQDQDNLIVQLQTNRGDKIIVDLGNAEHIEELDLQKGDRLSAWGRTVNIGDKRVFMAHKVQADDETVEIDRKQMPKREMRQGGRYADRSELDMSRHDPSQGSSRGLQSSDKN
jgi:hypothetical protein